MIALVPRRIAEIEASLVHALQCVNDNTALAAAIAAEHMRALIYGASVAQRDASAIRTVHTTRLVTSARRSIDFVWPSPTASERTLGGTGAKLDLCTDTLQRIETLGDAVDTGGGHWIAAPLRLVSSGGTSRYLLIGAAPAPAAHDRLGNLPTCAGASRFVSQQARKGYNIDDFVQEVDLWLGAVEPLAGWTSQVLASHEGRMESVEGLSADQLNIYAPDVARGQRRTGRWVPATQIGRSLEGVRLCRPLDRYARSYDPPYYLAHFDFTNRALSLRRSASVSRDLTLRLRFGLDVQMNTLRQLSIALSSQTFTIDRPLWLPLPEQRVYALGWLNQTGAEAPERLTFHADALPFVMHALRRLSIDPPITPRRAP